LLGFPGAFRLNTTVPTLLTTVVGSLSDGAIALIDLRAVRDAFAPVDPGK